MLTDNELNNINGGRFKWTHGLLIGSIVTLLAGIIDGFLRPLKCNN
jgi:lactobin A/cerein 7B family class IIb bacteriocin